MAHTRLHKEETFSLIDCLPDLPKSIRLIMIELHPNLYKGNEKFDIDKSIKSEGFRLVEQSGGSYSYERVS